MTSPAFEVLLAAYRRKAKCEPDSEAKAVLMLLAAFAGREARGGEASELLFLGAVLRHAALNHERFARRAEALKSVRGLDRMHRIDIDHAPTGLTVRKSFPIQCD
jgi:hypothetical protein